MNPQAPELPDILDVAPPVEIPPDPIHWAWWLLLAIVVLAIIAGLVWFLKSRRQDQQTSAKDKALERLSKLQQEAREMDGYQFGVVVSDILRSYLTEAHRLHASQQTSREFIEELERSGRFDEKRRTRLRDFLQTCDFLKYAPAGKASAPNQELLEQANFFIREDFV